MDLGKTAINEYMSIATTNAWTVVNEISRTDKALAMKLDHLIADIREASYRSGQYDGLELAKVIARGGSIV